MFHRVLDNERIQWKGEKSRRLSYQMIFEEPKEESEAPPVHEPIDITGILEERDEKWKIKLKREAQKAHDEGLEQGRIEGLETARAEIDTKLEFLYRYMDQAYELWKERQQLIDPGILDLALDIAEHIVGVPIEHPNVHKVMEEKLPAIFQRLDDEVKPCLCVSEQDLALVERLKEEHAPGTFVRIKVKEALNPGEFELDTNQERIVHTFKALIDDFREHLNVPSWK
ncbi:MAG: hypothetical protein AAFW89_08950 [Bacteroidota bacterium]